MNWIIKSAITINILKQLIAVIIVSIDYSRLNVPVINKEKKREKKGERKSNSRTARDRKYFYPDLRKSSFRASYYQPNEVETRPVQRSE